MIMILSNDIQETQYEMTKANYLLMDDINLRKIYVDPKTLSSM